VKTAFVFSGGGSLGALHVGMLRALLEADQRPDLVCGTSVGALNAAFFAANPAVTGVEALAQIWARLETRDIFPISPVSALMGLTPWGTQLTSPRGLRKLLRRELKAKRFEDLKLPLRTVATDLQSGAQVVHSTGPLRPALLASTAIPGVYPPRRLDGRLLVDGGVVNNSPISVAVQAGAERVIVLPAGYACSLRRDRMPPLAVIMQSLNLMLTRQLVRDHAHFKDRAHITLVPPRCTLDVSPHDFGQTEVLVNEGYVSTRDWLSGGGLDDSGVPTAWGEIE
jgi:NTE family protein